MEISMVRALAMILSIVCWSTASGSVAVTQDPKPVEVDFRVRSVGLGSSYAVVSHQLGQPLSSKREKMMDEEEVCGPSYTRLELNYKGVMVELNGDLQGRDFKVVAMEVTSPQLLIAPGVKIGMTENDVRSKLGDPWRERNESGANILDYTTKGNDGGAALYFVSGRLVKVQWSYTAC